MSQQNHRCMNCGQEPWPQSPSSCGYCGGEAATAVGVFYHRAGCPRQAPYLHPSPAGNTVEGWRYRTAREAALAMAECLTEGRPVEHAISRAVAFLESRPPASCCSACAQVREAAERFAYSNNRDMERAARARLLEVLALPCTGPTALPEGGVE